MINLGLLSKDFIICRKRKLQCYAMASKFRMTRFYYFSLILFLALIFSTIQQTSPLKAVSAPAERSFFLPLLLFPSLY